MRTRAEKLVNRMLEVYPYCVVNVEVAFEFIESGGQIDVEEFKEWLERNNYWRTYYNE